MRQSHVGELIATSAVAACVVGMMLVIGGVIASGLFLPGVIVIVLGLIAFGAAAVFDVLRTPT